MYEPSFSKISHKYQKLFSKNIQHLSYRILEKWSFFGVFLYLLEKQIEKKQSIAHFNNKNIKYLQNDILNF